MLDSDEPAAFEAVNARGRSPFFLLCDHAGNRVPRQLQQLGLDAGVFGRHIAWDIGAACVARRLSVLLDAALFLTVYSRLIVDCNRPPGAADAIPATSDHTPIPGNRALTAVEATARTETFFWPYHRAIVACLDERARNRQPSLLVSVHSFTPVMNGVARPWHVGITYHRDRRLAGALLTALGRQDDLVVGDNEPYAVSLESDYAIPVHGEGRGLPCALIEIRQDLIATKAGAEAWAARLAEALKMVEANAAIAAT